MPEHGLSSDGFVGLIVAAAIGSTSIYLVSAMRPRRGGAWPRRRSAFWVIGVAVAAASVTGPVAEAAQHDFRWHVVTHLVVGMVAPLLLVLAAPVTLALRTLELVPARRLSRLLRSRPLRLAAHPVTATALSVGGLWLFYGTSLFAAAHHSAALMTVVMLHFFVSGYLFTAAILSVDPDPHPSHHLTRLTALTIAVAAHSIIAKQIYAEPPYGITRVAAESGGQLMYYAGDAVHVVLIVLLLVSWARAPRRVRQRTSETGWDRLRGAALRSTAP